MDITDEKSARHKVRMQTKKAIVDDKIAKAKRDAGLLLVLTGNGKGKSSSAFGMVARAIGHGMKIGVAQFIKGSFDTGEEAFLGKQPAVEWLVLGEGFTWETQNLEKDQATAVRAWEKVKVMLQDESIHMVVLDELTYPIKYNWLDLDTILNDIAARPAMQHVIVTGRGAPQRLQDAADTVTNLQDVKHAFRDGVRAQHGVDL